MQFPGLNNFIYPFLEAIKDHRTYHRSQVTEHVISRLRLSDEQLEMHTQNNIPLSLCSAVVVQPIEERWKVKRLPEQSLILR